MTTERDDARLRRYREASATLDERPSPAARAAILAAAARQVEAQPRSATAPRAALRRRWPLAAAATVLLSSLAVMMATRTEQEMPTFTPPAELAREQLSIAPAPPQPEEAGGHAGPQKPAAPAPTPMPTRPAPRSDADTAPAPAPMARLKKSAPSAAPLEERSAVTPDAAERAVSPSAGSTGPAAGDRAAREPERASAEERRAVPAAPAAVVPPPPAIAPSSPATAPAAGALGAASAPPTGKAEASRFNDVPAARDAAAAAKQRTERQETASREVDRPAHEWLERIVKLRAEGRHAEADAELKRFRERFPEVQVPPAALPPSGTR